MTQPNDQQPAPQWYRTCQECGHKQNDTEPKGAMTTAYRNRKCKKCKSEALDYGTYPSVEGRADE